MFSKKIRKFLWIIIAILSIGNSSICGMDGEKCSEEQRFHGDILSTSKTIQALAIQLDNNRELFYVGESLSEFPKIEDKDYLEKMYEDKEIGLINGNKKINNNGVKEDENLLLSSVDINSILKNPSEMVSRNGEKINGIDRREIVNRPYTAPWSGIVALEMSFHKEGNHGYHHSATYLGSGCLIGKRFVLTAAHNIYDKETGYLACMVKALPGLNNGISYWEENSSDYYIHPEYFKTNSTKYDIALIDFKGFRHEKRIQPFSFGFTYVTEKKIAEKRLSITGFPGGIICENGNLAYLACKTMVTSKGVGEIAVVKDGVLIYDIDTSKGNSGGPVHFEENDAIFCCGVHSGGVVQQNGDAYNEGAYIDLGKYNLIKRWVENAETRFSRATNSTASSDGPNLKRSRQEIKK